VAQVGKEDKSSAVKIIRIFSPQQYPYKHSQLQHNFLEETLSGVAIAVWHAGVVASANHTFLAEDPESFHENFPPCLAPELNRQAASLTDLPLIKRTVY
jgi:hypothetical protein